ncbi:MAG TPA: hypothetical protein VF306_05320 [Pirellulales bacterium]
MQHTVREVDCQNVDRGSTDRRKPNEQRSIPPKMCAPLIVSRVKQPRHLSCCWVKTGNIRSFVVIARETSERKILKGRWAVVFFGNHVIHLVPRIDQRLRHLAILATHACAQPNVLAKQTFHPSSPQLV